MDLISNSNYEYIYTYTWTTKGYDMKVLTLISGGKNSLTEALYPEVLASPIRFELVDDDANLFEAELDAGRGTSKIRTMGNDMLDTAFSRAVLLFSNNICLFVLV